MLSELENIWGELEREAASKGRHGFLRRRILPEAACDLFLAVECPVYRRLLLIRVDERAGDRLRELPTSRGCEIELNRLPEDTADKVSVCLTLSEERFSDVFTSLVQDVCQHLAHIESDERIVDALIGRLKRWQAFLDRNRPDGLSQEAQRGLFGELWFLRYHLLPSIGTERAVRSWKGPSRAVHDFQLPGTSVEVKTTISRQHTKLLIRGERQLDESGLDHLFVFHLAIEAKECGGMALSELVELLRGELGQTTARENFEELLFEAGYLDTHAPHYVRPSYLQRGCHVFEVRSGFPRVVERDIPSGVGDLTYTVTVGHCMSFAISESTMEQIIRDSFSH